MKTFIILILTVVVLFLNTNYVQAQSCCAQNENLSAACVYSTSNPPVLGICQIPYGPIQQAQCPNTHICLTTHNPVPIPPTPTRYHYDPSLPVNQFVCNCTYTTVNSTRWDCRVSGENCNQGYLPDQGCNPNSTYDYCNTNDTNNTSYCTNTCVYRPCLNVGETPCSGNSDCCAGLVCGPARTCQALNIIPSTGNEIPPYDLCANVPEQASCYSCLTGGLATTQNEFQNYPGSYVGVYTAIGCVKNDPKEFIPSLARLIIGISGGIALLLMLVGAFLVTTAGGDPKKVESGKGTFTSAIIGLLIVIFSAVLLQFIGIQILQLPGL